MKLLSFAWLSLFIYPSFLAAHEIKTFKIRDVHPTQFSVGMEEVRARVKKLQSMRHSKDVEDYLQESAEKSVRVIKGPGNTPYLIDGHHHVRAYHEFGLKEFPAKVAKDWSDLSERDFWERMQKPGEEKVWLYDHLGHGKTITDLISLRHIQDLRDNPYRSLSWILKKIRVYEEMDVLFQEFKWGEFLRRKGFVIPANPLTKDYVQITQRSIEFLWQHASDVEKQLGDQGYNPLPKDPELFAAAQNEFRQKTEKLLLR